MNSLNERDLKRIQRNGDKQIAEAGGWTVEEAHQLRATTRPADRYHHEVRDSYNGNAAVKDAEESGCLWGIVVVGAALLTTLWPVAHWLAS